MLVLKGFANNALLVNNTPAVNSKIGEVSNQSLTYSRELGAYTDNVVAPNITLISFLSALDGVKQKVDPDFAQSTLTILAWIYNLAIGQSGTMYPDQFLQQILTQFQGKAQDFACGDIITDGTMSIPEWVSWKDLTIATADNYVKIWFVDASFQQQYDEFEIVIVPPITPLDDFFKSGAQVEALVNARTNDVFMAQMQAAKTDSTGVPRPESYIRADIYDYNDPITTTHLVPTTWGTLIYGIAGNNVDSIKDALVDYILGNSTHTRDEWAAIFPDIFKRTEFVITPDFGTYAIPNKTTQAGIYSPIANVSHAIELATTYASDYPAAHINSYTDIVAHPYKSLQMVAIGSIENKNNAYSLRDVYPDYIAVSSTSTDFNRMTQDTQVFAETLARLILVAEAMGPFTSIPRDFTRLTRNGKLYVVASIKNIHYLVTAKYNFPTP